MGARLTGLLGRLGGTPRRVLAVILLLTGAVVGLSGLLPDHGTRVLVLVRSLAAGHTLAVTDVRLEPRAGSEVPTGAVRDPAGAVGRRLVGAAGAGEVLTAVRLAPTAFVAGGDRPVVAVPVGAAAARLLTPGDHADVVTGSADAGWTAGAGGADSSGADSSGADSSGADSSGADSSAADSSAAGLDGNDPTVAAANGAEADRSATAVVAHDVLVLAVWSASSDSGAWSGPTVAGGVTVVVAADDDDARRLGALSADESASSLGFVRTVG